LLLVRQAGTQWHDNDQVIGKQDAELSQSGLSRAEKLAASLKNRQIDKVFASGLGRAIDTAKVISKYHKLRVFAEPRLDERGYGKLEGKQRQDVAAELKDLEMQDRDVIEGESGYEFSKRVISFLEQCLQDNPGKKIVLVTHAGPVQVIQRYFQRFDTSKGDDANEQNLSGLSEFLVKKLDPLQVEIKKIDSIEHLS